MADFDIIDVLGHYGIHVPPRSGYAKISCPWHADSTPSASVRDNKLHCFSCGWHGDALDVIKEQEQCGYADAVTKAEEITGTSNGQISRGARAGAGLFGSAGNHQGNGASRSAWGGLFA